MIGTILDGRYKILTIVGEGKASTVYEAQHQLMQRTVAIKMLHSELLADAKALERFKLEARAVSQLSHPNIVRIHDFGVAQDGEPYLVMDRLEGPSLAQIIAERGRIPSAEAVEIFSQVASGLAHAHTKGILHRDIKPGNIVLEQGSSAEGSVKVVDFGVAKLLGVEGEEALRLTKTGEVFASPLYMSPEQCMGRPLDERSDIYSLGCVMYETLSGQRPFAGATAAELVVQHTTQKPPPLHTLLPTDAIVAQLAATVHKAIEKDPARRYQSMPELSAALDQLRPRVMTATKDKRLILLRRHGRTLAFLFVLAVIALSGMAWINLTESGKEAFLKTRLAVLGLKQADADPELARTAQSLSGLQESQREFLDAAVTYRLCLPFLENSSGKESRRIGAAYEKIGDLYFDGLDKRNARTWYEKALNILEPTAQGDYADGKWASALSSWEGIAERRRRCFAPAEAGYASSFYYLGATQYRLGQFDKAIQSLGRARLCQMLPDCADPIKLDSTLLQLAEVYETGGKYDQAESLLRPALESRKSLSSLNSREMASAYDVCTAVYSSRKSFNQAEVYGKQAAQVWKLHWHVGDLSDSAYLNSLAQLGFIYWQTGKYELSRATNRQTLKLSRELPEKERMTLMELMKSKWNPEKIPE